MGNKGKVYPTATNTIPSDSLSIFKLLPAAILALTALLSIEEQEVLAYMLTRSIKSTTTPFFKNKKKSFNIHNPPLFHCECFHCYTSYWFKWDSSPNRELIHQAIEAFEDHLNNNHHQLSKKKGKKKDKKMARKNGEIQNLNNTHGQEEIILQVQEFEAKEEEVEILNKTTSQAAEDAIVVSESETAVSVRHQKGLARRVLPDVLGLLNSRWWSLWSPNV